MDVLCQMKLRCTFSPLGKPCVGVRARPHAENFKMAVKWWERLRWHIIWTLVQYSSQMASQKLPYHWVIHLEKFYFQSSYVTRATLYLNLLVSPKPKTFSQLFCVQKPRWRIFKQLWASSWHIWFGPIKVGKSSLNSFTSKRFSKKL